MHLTALSQNWWLSMNRSPWERRIYGTYIRTACTFERRSIEQLRQAGISPLLPVLAIPRIIIDHVVQGAGDRGDDGGDAVGVDDLVVPDEGDVDDMDDIDDPRLLTAG